MFSSTGTQLNAPHYVFFCAKTHTRNTTSLSKDSYSATVCRSIQTYQETSYITGSRM